MFEKLLALEPNATATQLDYGLALAALKLPDELKALYQRCWEVRIMFFVVVVFVVFCFLFLMFIHIFVRMCRLQQNVQWSMQHLLVI